jgi:diacylglycerol kinase (ATP)
MKMSNQTRLHPTYSEQRVLAVLKPAELFRLDLLKTLLKAVFPRIEIVSPQSLEHLKDLLRRCRTTHPLVVAIGGDGTLHQVLQELDLERQVLALLPLGTGNDFARAIGYPTGLQKKISRLATLHPLPTDFGEMSGHRFINSAGFGLDSATLALRANNPNNRILQNYNLAFIKVLARLKPVVAEIEIDGERLSGNYFWTLAMNNAFIGGGTRIAPAAKVDDGELDVLLVRADSKWELLVNLPRAIKGRHLGMQQVVYRQATQMKCRCAEPVTYLAADGELHFHGERLVEFQTRVGSLTMLR